MNVFDPAQLGWRCCRANPELRGFSRGQASQVGRLRTASRRSNTNPTVVMRHVLLKNVLGSV
jgi:hypothetical protein